MSSNKFEQEIKVNSSTNQDGTMIVIVLQSDDPIGIVSIVKTLSNLVKYDIRRFGLDPEEVLASRDDRIIPMGGAACEGDE